MLVQRGVPPPLNAIGPGLIRHRYQAAVVSFEDPIVFGAHCLQISKGIVLIPDNLDLVSLQPVITLSERATLRSIPRLQTCQAL